MTIESSKQSKFSRWFNRFFGTKEEEAQKPQIVKVGVFRPAKTKHSKNKKGKCKGCFGKPAWMRGAE